MSDYDRDPHPDSLPQGAESDPDHLPHARDDERPDIQQVVEARADALARGEGGSEPDPMTKPGEYSGVSGDGGVVKNQDLTAQ